jgi:alpha-glucosidase
VLGLQGGTQEVTGIVAEMQAADADIAAVWLQDWTGRRTTSFGDRLWWTWQLDRQQYPGWEEMVAQFEAQGIKVLTYINPWLVDAAEKGDTSIRNLYQEAAEAGYLVQTDAGVPYLVDQNGFDAALMDFTNPAARDWYADIIAEEVIGSGASGFMADFGEGMPYDGVLYQGSPATEHNRYPQLWSEVVQQGCLRADMPDCVAFMRSGYLTSSQHTPMMWAGDQMVDFSHGDGLASAVLSMNAGGVSGSPLWHSDVGGYTSINAVVKDYVRPPDLNERWAEMEAFGVMMRTHEGNRPAANQQVYDTPQTRAAFAKMTRLHAALADYREQVVAEAVESGLPARRHPWLVFPESAVADADLQFFLGEHLMVAPVVESGADSVSVTFPPGRWVHVLTGEQFEGDQTVQVSAPLGTPAAFVQQGDPVGEQIVAALAAVE